MLNDIIYSTMKATTLQKRIEKNLYTKSGKLAKKYSELEFSLVKGKYYGGYYSGKGRFSRATLAEHYAIKEAWTLLGLDFIEGNDAPRGGVTGTFIQLTEKGKRQVKEWVKPILERQAAEQAAEKAAKIAEKNAISAMVELLEAHPTEFDEVFHGVSKGYLSRRQFGGKIHRLAHNLHQINNEIFQRAVNIYNGDETNIRYYNAL